MQSHPEWVRGLKLYKGITVIITTVAPRVGAWIETYIWEKYIEHKKVAPRVGAWIETVFAFCNLSKIRVAPRVGAWIETSLAKGTN